MGQCESGLQILAGKLSIYWRLLATGASFLIFGLGGLALRAGFFPLLFLLVRQRQRRMVMAREVIRIAFRGFVGLMQVVGVLRYEIRGRELLERTGLLILANHPTLIDTVFLMAFVRHADCIVKSNLQTNPFTRGPVLAAGYVSNARGSDLVADCIASLEAGSNLIIFPEGTRTVPGVALCLKRGAANIAVRGGRNVTPVHIRCVPLTLGKGEKWWRIPPRPVHFRIDVLPDIPIGQFMGHGESHVIAARNLTGFLKSVWSCA